MTPAPKANMQNEVNSRNMILAIVLSAIVIFGWNYFYGLPKVDQQRQAQQASLQPQNPNGAGQAGSGQAGAPAATSAQPAVASPPVLATRSAALAAGPRVAIDTPRVNGSVSLRGGRLDDLSLKNYRETTDPNSPEIVLLSPAGGPEAYYADFGWVAQDGAAVAVPRGDTLWTAEGKSLGVDAPLTLTWDNGQGLVFHRKISIDDNYLFTVEDSVDNRSQAGVTLYPYGAIARHGMPHVLGFYILHEGLIGVAGDKGLQEIKYADLVKEKSRTLKSDTGWIGIVDKYWATALLPEQGKPFDQRYSVAGADPTFQTAVTMEGRPVAPGASVSATTRLFAGAKEVNVIDGYEKTLGVQKFDLLIDWGWFWFITQPIFKLITFIHKLVGNFGVSILIVTVLIKAAFFPLANKSYESMAKMKAAQPQMAALKERYPDDKMKQQQAMMELYKKERINPLSGCIPVVLQIPVFFALYKTLFMTIEMRHAPFFGWIKDLAAPDPTSIFNLFGLLPIALPDISYLHLGVWPIIMGFTMFLQMKMNPEPPDPVQRAIFSWMPLIFTFTLATFPAGLVIYWAWNNTLSVSQQYLIMKKNGVKVELWDNLRNLFRKRTPPQLPPAK